MNDKKLKTSLRMNQPIITVAIGFILALILIMTVPFVMSGYVSVYDYMNNDTTPNKWGSYHDGDCYTVGRGESYIYFDECMTKEEAHDTSNRLNVKQMIKIKNSKRVWTNVVE